MRDSIHQGISDQSTRNPRIVWTGAILVTIGLSLLLFAGEWFATFDACVANPICNAEAPPGTITGYLALMFAGVALAVFGAVVAFYRQKGLPRRALILWLGNRQCSLWGQSGWGTAWLLWNSNARRGNVTMDTPAYPMTPMSRIAAV